MIQIINDDCRNVLPSISADIYFTSPPYPGRRSYGLADFDWSGVVLGALGSIVDTGKTQILVNLGQAHTNGEVDPYWFYFAQGMRAAGWRWFGMYIWDQLNGMTGHWHGRLAPSHELVLHFNKSAAWPMKWIECKTAGRRMSGGVRGKKHPTSDKVDKMTHAGRPIQATKIPDSVIRIDREMRRKVKHPAMFPVALAEYFIKSYPGVVCDPFMGSGSTLVAAKNLDRDCVGIDINKEYCQIARQRTA